MPAGILCMAVSDHAWSNLQTHKELPMFYWGLLIGVIVGANIGLILSGLFVGNKLQAGPQLSE